MNEKKTEEMDAKTKAATAEEISRSIGLLRSLNDYDICCCGDYRHQHENGTGKCRMPDDICHGMQPCESFRLAERA